MASLVPFCILNSDNWHVKGVGILCHGCIQYLSHMGVRGELYATTVRQDNKFCERVLSGSYSSDRIFCMAIWVLWLGEHLVFEYRHQTHFWEVSFTKKRPHFLIDLVGIKFHFCSIPLIRITWKENINCWLKIYLYVSSIPSVSRLHWTCKNYLTTSCNEHNFQCDSIYLSISVLKVFRYKS